MEAITGPLMWTLSPAGLAIALFLLGFILSGLPGRIFPDLDVSGRGFRARRRRRALAAAGRRARISK
ncbi:MAG: hypothetical protein HKN74_02500 [Acidimicrobiia bacterium]|nr:hypothetical protein [Acidimicrobiia bacterium]MBT8217994.1 hypothetical protein [Acidimicrobiia bacterium]NNF09133.1 hypothetical protein [Acidimicrobiia bacterium]NNL70480.1 hypothetical protein [Acidimicrobiia bacterium]